MELAPEQADDLPENDDLHADVARTHSGSGMITTQRHPKRRRVEGDINAGRRSAAPAPLVSIASDVGGLVLSFLSATEVVAFARVSRRSPLFVENARKRSRGHVVVANARHVPHILSLFPTLESIGISDKFSLRAVATLNGELF